MAQAMHRRRGMKSFWLRLLGGILFVPMVSTWF
jgi:hypothetical protein